MAFLDRINACNNADLNGFIPFRVDDMGVGWIRPGFAEQLAAWPRVFEVSDKAVELQPHLDSFASRTRAVAEVTRALVAQGIIDRSHGELYPVTSGSRDDATFLLDRASAPYFGIRAFGQHLNGFVLDRGELKMWVGRRSRNKSTFPGKLDNMVAGGLPHGIDLQDNIGKECWEEAAIPKALARNARPAGAIAYCAETQRGLKPDIMYCYDLELPADFVPRCNDGEVDEYYLWPVDKVANLVSETVEFKLNCNLVIIHFLIRHGFIAPDHQDYLALTANLFHWTAFQRWNNGRRPGFL